MKTLVRKTGNCFKTIFYTLGFQPTEQTLIDTVARYMKLRYEVVDNFVDPKTFKAKITLTNTGPDILPGNILNWSLYFSHSSLIEPDSINPNGTALRRTGLWIYHVNGYLNKIVPTASFPGIPSNNSLEIPFRASGVSVARTDVMPNWYLVAPNTKPRTIDSTSGDMLDFVGAFDTERKYKRQPSDRYSPYTVNDRFNLWQYSGESGVKQIIPTPFTENLDISRRMRLDKETWLVVTAKDELLSEGKFLAGKIIIS